MFSLLQYWDCEKIFRKSEPPLCLWRAVIQNHNLFSNPNTRCLLTCCLHAQHCTSLSCTQRGLWVYEHVCLQINAPVIKRTAFAHFQGDSTTIGASPSDTAVEGWKKSGRQICQINPSQTDNSDNSEETHWGPVHIAPSHEKVFLSFRFRFLHSSKPRQVQFINLSTS